MPDLLISSDGFLTDILQTGKDYLAEIVIDNIMNLIMTDLYSPDFGTDIKTWPSTNLNSKKEIELKLTLHIQRIEERIKNEQALTPSTDDEEMLESIKIISIDSYQDGTSNRRIWLVKLLITTINGETTVIEKEI